MSSLSLFSRPAVAYRDPCVWFVDPISSSALIGFLTLHSRDPCAPFWFHASKMLPNI
ncbi:hypothetical protein P7K49_013557 [Saguinus oedipus]|uniref:Uncharacterized protein n=1 Tax=Saguinus oedipus TaxID=9490 RepID=A0ABQ9VG97_SAGOE|nr:hypothetical protein P7K49_013557 [Saguinus oedipus]